MDLANKAFNQMFPRFSANLREKVSIMIATDNYNELLHKYFLNGFSELYIYIEYADQPSIKLIGIKENERFFLEDKVNIQYIEDALSSAHGIEVRELGRTDKKRTYHPPLDDIVTQKPLQQGFYTEISRTHLDKTSHGYKIEIQRE